MENEIYVSCHAPSLSLLLFETVRSAHDQKGLLIGEICREIISEKTDENEMNREQRTTIYLEHCVPIKDNDFFGNIGKINKEKLQKYIGQCCNKIVGWYSFRRNTRVHSKSLREVLTHKSLIQYLKPVRPEYFIAAFMSASVGASLSTHIYNHIFMRFHLEKGIFEPLKFKIYTMSDKIINMNGYSFRNSFPTSKNFEDIINPTQEGASPVMSVLTINKAIAEYLKNINKKLEEAERSRCDLELQIKNLRELLCNDKLRDIKVTELEHGPEIKVIEYVRFDSNINYNPGRKENPIKIVQLNNAPRVSEETDLKMKNNVQESRNKSHSKMHPDLKNVKLSRQNLAADNINSIAFHSEGRSNFAEVGGSSLLRCSSNDESHLNADDSESNSYKGERSLKEFEENETISSVQYS